MYLYLYYKYAFKKLIEMNQMKNSIFFIKITYMNVNEFNFQVNIPNNAKISIILSHIYFFIVIQSFSIIVIISV